MLPGTSAHRFIPVVLLQADLQELLPEDLLVHLPVLLLVHLPEDLLPVLLDRRKAGGLLTSLGTSGLARPRPQTSRISGFFICVN